MLVFPQFGASSAQYPVRRRRMERTVKNRMADGRVWKAGDAAGAWVEWELPLVGLSEGERGALEAFFLGVEGALGSFTFLDPVDNLLSRSEALNAGEWVADPLLQLAAGVADPQGGTNAYRLVNAGQTPQGIRQTIAAPGWFLYCVSVWVRSNVTLMVKLQGKDVGVSGAWQRVSVTDQQGNTIPTVAIGLEVPVGGQVEVFGFQAEAQSAASEYKRTQAKGGVYSQARLAEDRLVWTAEGPNNHGTTVRVISRAQG